MVLYMAGSRKDQDLEREDKSMIDKGQWDTLTAGEKRELLAHRVFMNIEFSGCLFVQT